MRGSTSLKDVYEASYGRLVLQVFALCGDAADAEDAVQEAFVKAIGQGRAFDRVLNPEAWLRTAALDPDQRHVMVLHYLADLGVAEIARELGVPEGTVKSRLFRGRERLAPMLDEREESDHV